MRLAGQEPDEVEGRAEVLVIKVLGGAEALEAGGCEAGAEVAFGQPLEQLVRVMVSVFRKVTVSPLDTDVARLLTTEV